MTTTTETSTTATDVDIAIVGAGPVGLTLALLLAEQNWSVRILERHPAAYPLPRAVGMSHESLRTFQAIGMRPTLEQQMDLRSEMHQKASFFAADGEVLLEQVMPGGDISGYPAMAAFNQPDLEAALAEKCNAHPLVEIEWGMEVLSVDQSPDNTTTRISLAEGEERSVTARFTIGCDGANSTVANQMDVAIEDTGFSSTWLIVDLLPDAELFEALPFGQTLDPTRPTTLVPSGVDRRRIEFMLLDGEDPDDMVAPENVWSLVAPWGAHPGNAELVRVATYTFGGRWAEHWRDGRILVAGDAAHVMPPFMAQGFNSGIRDAATLAWKLDLVLSGTTSSSLLDTYTSERLPHVQSIVEQSVAFGEMICILDPEAAAGRDAMLRMARENPEMAPPPPPPWKLGPGILSNDDGHAGLLGVQARVTHEGETALLDDHLGGAQWCLLGNDIDPVSALGERAVRYWAQLKGKSVDLGPSSEYEDIDGRYRAWFAELGACAVLVRPDFHLFGTAQSPDEIDELVSQLGALLALQ